MQDELGMTHDWVASRANKDQQMGSSETGLFLAGKGRGKTTSPPLVFNIYYNDGFEL